MQNNCQPSVKGLADENSAKTLEQAIKSLSRVDVCASNWAKEDMPFLSSIGFNDYIHKEGLCRRKGIMANSFELGKLISGLKQYNESRRKAISLAITHYSRRFV